MHNLEVSFILGEKKTTMIHSFTLPSYFSFHSDVLFFFNFTFSMRTPPHNFNRNHSLVLSGDKLSAQHSGQPSVLFKKFWREMTVRTFLNSIFFLDFCKFSCNLTCSCTLHTPTNKPRKPTETCGLNIWHFLNICDSCCCQDDNKMFLCPFFPLSYFLWFDSNRCVSSCPSQGDALGCLIETLQHFLSHRFVRREWYNRCQNGEY